VHQIGAKFIQQVHNVSQAEEAAERGVDVIIAQGTEAGGFTGVISSMTLIPQVVDTVRPIPVVAAGGIFDGRGLAASLALGATGVNLGTRFLASMESAAADAWKERIVSAKSEETFKADVANIILPPPAGVYEVSPRSLATPFLEEWSLKPEEAIQRSEALREEVLAAIREGRLHELAPFTGQSAGGIKEVLSAGVIVERIIAEAEQALAATAYTTP
jgi:nitronate monooxygenase/enoyl-[acyl-carrier protein] reductase II